MEDRSSRIAEAAASFAPIAAPTPATTKFRPIETRDLADVCVVAQCLDNQWVPRPLLLQMLRNRQGLADVRDERERLVRAEYHRALVNAPQVAINRSFLYTNHVVRDAYDTDGPQRDAFLNLLASGAIVPVLFNEATPTTAPAFDHEAAFFRKWQTICDEASPRCVRLSWDDDDNHKLITTYLRQRFHDFASVSYNRDMKEFLAHLGMEPVHEVTLRDRLYDLAEFCLRTSRKSGPVTRDQVYAEFVTAQGTRTDEGKYDDEKPFAAAIKELVDLRYNVNLPDALNRYAMTASDSLGRVALQELEQLKEGGQRPAELAALAEKLFIGDVVSGFGLKSMDLLTIEDVQAIRRSDEWEAYATQLSRLIRKPELAPTVYARYADLANVIADRKGKRREETWGANGKWIAEVVVSLSAGIVKLHLTGENPLYEVVLDAGKGVAKKATEVLVTFAIRHFASAATQVEHYARIDILRGRHNVAPSEYQRELIAELEKLRVRAAPPGTVGRNQANINYPDPSDQP